MKISKYFIPGLLSCGLVFSCTKDFEEINTNPNGPVTVPATLMIPALVEPLMDQMYSVFNGGDMGNCWAQHWSKVQYNDEERYNPRPLQFDAVWNFAYAATIQDTRVMGALAVTESNENLQAIALTMEVYAFALLTDLWGDVPYSEALKAKEGINLPKYDLQSDIYPDLLLKLDQANALYAADGGAITASSDILYGGDYTKWQKFTNSLKLRLLMRMSRRADFSRQAELQTLISSRPIFTSNADEAKLVYLGAAPNNNPVNASVIGANREEFKVNSVLVDKLTSSSDPRLAVMAQRNSSNVYRGKPSGIIDVPSDDYNYENVSPLGTAYIAATAPGFFLSYAEQEFFIAEAAKRGLLGTPNDDATAAIHFNNAVRASMASNGVTTGDADTYLTNHPYAPAAGLTQIHDEKWISLFGQGMEAWTEWRRTGIPELEPAIEAPINEIPSRYKYPPLEQSLNRTNYTAAVAVQGPDLLTTKIWWMK